MNFSGNDHRFQSVFFVVFFFFFPGRRQAVGTHVTSYGAWDTGDPLACVVFHFPSGVWIGKEKLVLGLELVVATKVK